MRGLVAGLLFGVTGSKIGGTRRILYLVPLLGIAAGLGSASAYDWWWVALLTVSAAIAGGGFRFGWFPALLMLPYAATFVVPGASARDATIYGVVVAVGTLYGVILARRFKATPMAAAAPIAAVVALIAAVSFLVALTQARTYWLMYGIYTFSLVLALSTPGHVGVEAAHRRSEILIGIGLLVLGLAAVHSFGKWVTTRYPQDELSASMPVPSS